MLGALIVLPLLFYLCKPVFMGKHISCEEAGSNSERKEDEGDVKEKHQAVIDARSEQHVSL